MTASPGRREVVVLWASFTALVIGCAWLLVRPFFDGEAVYRPRERYAYFPLLMAMLVPYAGAVWATRRGVSKRLAIGAAVALHVLLLFAPLHQAQDAYNSLFYGKIAAVHGESPYVSVPEDFAADPWLTYLPRWRDTASAYGPIWTAICALIARAATATPPIIALKAIVIAFGLWSVREVARGAGEPGRAVVLFGWNPVVFVSVALSAHPDALVAAFLVAGFNADKRGRTTRAALLLAAASLVKAYAILALVLYLVALARRRTPLLRPAGAAAGLMGLSVVPFALVGGIGAAGLVDVAGLTSRTPARVVQVIFGSVMSEDAAGFLVRVLGVVIVLAVLVWWIRKDAFPTDPWPAAVAVLLAYAFVAPWSLYWHHLGLLALAAVAGSVRVRGSAYALGTLSLLGPPIPAAAAATLKYGVAAAALRLRSLRRFDDGGAPT